MEEYLNSAAENFKSIILKVTKLQINYKITSDNYIEFYVSKELTGRNVAVIQMELNNSEFGNWMLFVMLGNSKGKYNYRLVNYLLEIDVKNYNRINGLNILIDNGN